MFEYVAISKGKLSRPFRNVKPGDHFSSLVEMKGSWFVPKAEYKKPSDRPLPLMSGMKIHARGRDALAPQNTPAPYADANYDRAMEGIKRLEAQQDGKPIIDPQAPVTVVNASVQGSGDKDVLGE